MDIGTLRTHHLVKVCNGSGVIVKPLDKEYLYILTCYHVLFDGEGNEKEISLDFDTYSSIEIQTIVVEDKILCKEKDLGVLKIRIDHPDRFEFLRLSSEGTASTHIGFPKAREYGAVCKTSVLSILHETSSVGYLVEYECDKVTAKEEIEGMSGGGVFDKDLRLIGIHKQNSVADTKESLGKYCYIPIKHYKELLKQYSWSPIQEFNLDSFEDFLSCVFYIDDGFVRKRVISLLLEIKAFKDKISDWSPARIISTLKDQGLLDRKMENDSISRDLWVDFSEFIIAMLILLEINENEEDFINAVFKQFYFVFSESKFDFYDVRSKLDTNVLSGIIDTGLKIVVGGLNEPKTLRSCVMSPDIPNIGIVPFRDLLDITQSKDKVLEYMTFIHGKMFKQGVYYLAESDFKVNLDNYRKILLKKIEGSKNESSRN